MGRRDGLFYQTRINIKFQYSVFPLEKFFGSYYDVSSVEIYPIITERENIMFYGALEMSIMNVIWYLQEKNEDANISVTDIVEGLNNNDTERAYTTIKTVMDRLVGKGVLVRYKDGKKFYYRSTLDRNEASRKVIETVSSQFFDGSYVELLRFIERECEPLLV